jgi:hypothetical protein
VSARLHPDDLEAIVERTVRGVVDRLDARIRKARPTAKRRTREPELAAQLAREHTPAVVDEVAKARAARALRRIRGL